jgi:hypothetical protein
LNLRPPVPNVVLIALVALADAGLLVAHLLKWRLAGLLISIHAALVVSGFVILAAYVLLESTTKRHPGALLQASTTTIAST